MTQLTGQHGPATLGLCPMGHDLSITVLDSDGQPLIVAEEERYSRLKQGNFVMSPAFVWEVLDEIGVAPAVVRTLAIANLPQLMEQRGTASLTDRPPYGHSRAYDAMIRAVMPRLTLLNRSSFIVITTVTLQARSFRARLHALR